MRVFSAIVITDVRNCSSFTNWADMYHVIIVSFFTAEGLMVD